MAKRNINRETLLAVKLSKLRRHLVTCYACRAASASGDYDGFCGETKLAIVAIALKWETNVSARMRAAHDRNGWIYPCPDVSAHGPAYAIAAEPVIVTDSQGRLL